MIASRFILNPYTISNSKREIVSWISSLTNAADTLVGMEATGGYESLLVSLLHEHGVALAVVNPRQVRDFAKGLKNPNYPSKRRQTIPKNRIRKSFFESTIDLF